MERENSPRLIPTNALPKIIAMAATGQVDEAFRTVGYMVPRGTPNAPLRAQIIDVCTRDIGPLIVAALPWLEGELFNPRSDDREAKAMPSRLKDVLLAMLDEADWHGLPLKDFSADELSLISPEVAEVSAPTGGRPRKMIRLKRHDHRHDAFATRGDY